MLPKCFFVQWKLTLGRNLLVNDELSACCHDKAADNKQSLSTNSATVLYQLVASKQQIK